MTGEAFFLKGGEVKEKPYRYRACGLDGIYLLNGFVEEDDAVSISDIEGLHKAIARHLVVNRKALAPKEIRFVRTTMGLTQTELAERLGNNSQSVARWEKGQCDMPGAAEKLLRLMFLASVMTKEEFDTFREFVISKLSELDQMEELRERPAQFELFDHWMETKIAA